MKGLKKCFRVINIGVLITPLTTRNLIKLKLKIIKIAVKVKFLKSFYNSV